uniref:Ig-like domain-containing protein n=1 Tax=Anabas testudineus TaxID=64144 RepID=A0A3Q1IFE0_ANATE
MSQLFDFENSLVPVITVQVDEPVTFTCVLPDEDLSRTEVYWYKQSAGDNLKLIVTVMKNINPVYSSGFSDSRFEERLHKNITTMFNSSIFIGNSDRRSNYTVVQTVSDPVRNLVIFLTSNYTVVQTVSDPVRPGDSVTLQCSVLSDSDNKTCPGDHSVYWFRAGSDQSHPEIIYTGGNNECEKRSDSVKSCVYRFSKNVSSSDAGTYYCAVATCGQILFGDGTNLQIGKILCSLKVSIVCSVIHDLVSQKYQITFAVPINIQHTYIMFYLLQAVDGHDLNYAALHFSGRKGTRGNKKKELKTEEIVYSQVKY